MKLELIIGQADPIDCLDSLEKIGCKFTEISREIDEEVANSYVVVEVADSEDFINKVKESFVNMSFNTPDMLNSILDSDEKELWSQ
tara:strand:- start:624 stop:881 length:258 start_codon:yes stop_codon:yes gene_type:complete